MIRIFDARHAAARFSTRALMIGGTALAVLAASAARAQSVDAAATSTNPAADSAGGDDIVVTGARPIVESEAAALRVQKASPSLVSVVAADSVGRLPDQNIAQAISRLPGVAVQRDQGQARYVNLRGAPINWTTLSFDGINVVSPEGRDARFDSIPSAIASQIIVRKAVTPNMTGETIAGNVDIVTRSAFDYNGFHLSGKAGAGYVELGKRQEYEGQLVVSDRWETGIGEIGILASGSYYQRDMVTDNFETDWEAVSQDRRPGFETRDWARETENKLYRLTRRNYSATGRIDWRPDPSHRLFATSIYSAFTDDELRSNYIFDLDDQQSRLSNATAACGAAAAPRSPDTGYANVCTGNTPYRGTVYGVDINSNFMVRDYLQSVFTNTVGGDHDFDGGWQVRWRGNYTKSVDDRSAPVQLNYDSPSAAASRPTVVYDLTDPQLARVELYRTLVNADGTFGRGARVRQIEDFPLALSRLRALKAKDITDAYTGKIDVSNESEMFGGSTRITVGAQYDNRTKESNERIIDISSAAAFTAAGIPTGFDQIAIPGGFKGEIPLGYDFRYFGEGKIKDLADRAAGTNAFAPVVGNFYKVREEIWSGYGMVESRYDWGNFVLGARVERIKNDSRAFVPIGGVSTLVDVSKTRTLVYPSAHINFDLDDTKKLRFSANTGAARPDYDQLRPNFTFDDANRTISGGNPEAKPEKTKGVDAYFEWYMQPQGFFSLGAYYKDVKDALIRQSGTFGLDVLNSGGTDRSQYVLTTIGNAGDGWIWGIEGAISQQLEPFTAQLGLPDWLGGFGIQANATFTKSRVELTDGRETRLPGTSKFSYNLSGYYEKYGLSARVSYQRRSAWLDSFDTFSEINGVFRGENSGDQYWAADDELDASLRYAITPNLEVYADFANLLNGPGRRFAGVSARTLEHETFGRRYTGGVRVNF